jgi:hypothetical protein
MNRILLVLITFSSLVFSQGNTEYTVEKINVSDTNHLNFLFNTLPPYDITNYISLSPNSQGRVKVYMRSSFCQLDSNAGSVGIVNKRFIMSDKWGTIYPVSVTIPTQTSQLSNNSGFLTGITSGQVIAALGYTPSSITYVNGTGLTSTGTNIKTFAIDPTVVMTVNRASDSIANINTRVSTKTTLADARSGITLTTIGSSGASTYNQATGAFNIPNYTGKRRETYSGTTSASGVYTVTFATAFSVAPNIQANIIGGTNTNLIKITSISTTAFTVTVVNRNDVVGILPTYSNVNGAIVDVIITEK